MTFLKSSVLVVLFSVGAFAQTSSSDSSVAEQLKKLQDALAEQQKQITMQQREIEALRNQLAARSEPHVVDAAIHTTQPPDGLAIPAVAAQNTAVATTEETQKSSPLSFRIGGAEFTPGGFIDFTNVFRTTNTGNPIGTNFGSIPFNNQVQGHLTEFRSTAQHSRLSLKVNTTYGQNKITGYVEADFNGNDPGNVFVSSNSHTNRLRLYWVDLKRGKWEVLGGQSWSLLTPDRVGISPDPSDIFNTRNMDPNYQVGLAWTRQAGFRLGYHPDEHWALALGVENPQQYNAGEVAFPSNFSAQLGGQVDPGNLTTVPNLHPDIIPKVTYDTNFAGDRHFHGEIAGLLTTVKTTILPTGPGSVVPAGFNPTFGHHSTTGGGGSGAIFVDLLKELKFVGTGFYSYGGGRYLFGLGPQTVNRPFLLTTVSSVNIYDANNSLVHAGGTVLGFEAPVSKSITLAGYYGGAYFQRNTFPDITATTNLIAPIRCAPNQPLQNKPCIGFGGFGSGNSNNRALQEGTFDWIQTFFKHPQYGSLQLIMQYSYVTRAPWFVPTGSPRNAHLSMAYVDLRYTLP